MRRFDLNVPILSARKARQRQQIEDEASQKAIQAVAEAVSWSGASKGFLDGNAATMMSAAATTGTPSTSWSGSPPQNSMQTALIARVTQNLASGFARAPEDLELQLAQQGLSWGPPFPPGRPLDPFWGYRRPPRTWDFAVGENVQLTPRQRRIPFETIKAIWDSYDVAQICTRHLINDVRSLDYSWEPIPGIKEDVSEDIEAAVAFFDSPDKRQPFRAWLAEYLQDVIKYDAGALYIRQTMDGSPLALEVVSGATIIPLIDFYGRRPEDEDDDEDTEDLFDGQVTPAYLQIIEGLPWDWLAADDLIYQPWNPEPESQYGRAPLEAVLLSANTDIRFQWHFLQYFTEGTIPEGFMEAPPDQSDPEQIRHWQDVWDAVMVGDQAKKTQIRWVPNGSKFDSYKSDTFDAEFPLYLMRRTCAAHGITPNDLGFTENVNKSSGDTQIDVQFRVGTAPLLRHCEDVINLFTKQYLKLRCRIRFDDGRETEDRVATATAMGIYIDHGVISPDEPRQTLGYPVDKSRPMPRFVNNARAGPIPLSALESMAGTIDEETFAPKELISTPFAAPPGPIPAQGTPEAIAAAEHSAQVGRDLVEETTGKPPSSEEPEEPIKPPEAEKGVDNTGGPGVTKSFSNPTTVTGGTDGITVTSDSNNFLDEDDDEDDEAVKTYTAVALKRWRTNARSRMKKGQRPRKFIDPYLPQPVHDEIWRKLSKAKSRQEVDAAFADAGNRSAGSRPAFHSQADAIVAYYAPQIHDALQGMLSSEAIDSAMRAAYTAVKKGVEGRAAPEPNGEPPNLRDSTDSLHKCDTCCLFAHPVCVMYSDWKVRPDQMCDGWELAIDDQSLQKAAGDVEASLKAALKPAKLKPILEALYGDSFLQGGHDAARAAGATVAHSLQGVSSAPSEDYWSKWVPGHGAAASQAADGAMRDLLDQAGQTIAGISDTGIDRIGNMIAEGLSKGDSYETTAKAIREVVSDPERAEVIANTEYARAMTVASEQTNQENGIEEEDWMAEDDACPECRENADASPIKAGEDWPNGPVPVHPRCRCAQAPHVELTPGGE